VNYAAALPFMGTNKKKFADLINEAANRHQVDAKLVHAVIQAESAYNARAHLLSWCCRLDAADARYSKALWRYGP